MNIVKPFHRICRPNKGSGGLGYIFDKEYAVAPVHYVRAFLLIQDDLKKIFEFVEPADNNLNTYSFRIHELLIKTCIEIEANFKAIFKENTYKPINKKGVARKEDCWNINDYWKINKTHHLSSYKVVVPIWNGENSLFEPFKEWQAEAKLPWYDAYNKSKHDRHTKFIMANFNNLVNAVAGLFVVLSSQFNREDFLPKPESLSLFSSRYSMLSGIGNFFAIEFPKDWSDEEIYDFDWEKLKIEKDHFQKFDYNAI